MEDGEIGVGDVVCSQCNLRPALYKCPACSARTCSLDCVRRHKDVTKCTGVRDRTVFVAKQDMGDSLMQSGMLLSSSSSYCGVYS